MTAREKPRWSAETARKNTVGLFSTLPRCERPLGKKAPQKTPPLPLPPCFSLTRPRASSGRASSSFDRSFLRRSTSRVKETSFVYSSGIRVALKFSRCGPLKTRLTRFRFHHLNGITFAMRLLSRSFISYFVSRSRFVCAIYNNVSQRQTQQKYLLINRARKMHFDCNVSKISI